MDRNLSLGDTVFDPECVDRAFAFVLLRLVKTMSSFGRLLGDVVDVRSNLRLIDR